jgi:hypothetical protein
VCVAANPLPVEGAMWCPFGHSCRQRAKDPTDMVASHTM